MSNNITSKQTKHEQVLSLHKKGKSNTEISEILGVPRSTVFDWISGRRRSTKVKTTIIEEESSYDENDNRVDIITEQESDQLDSSPFVSNFSKYDEQKIKEILMNIKAVQYPAPPKPRTYFEPNKIALVIGDTHFGVECWNTLDIFLQVVDDLKPQKIILNGTMIWSTTPTWQNIPM
jgi:predicted transcriptional regulator